MTKRQQYEKGISGESQAERYLISCGMERLESRFRAEDGEIDLIMLYQGMIVFVEVKYRPNGLPGSGLMAVTPNKQRRMARAAAAYLAKREEMDLPVRFDVVEITRAGVMHIPNAFQPGNW